MTKLIPAIAVGLMFVNFGWFVIEKSLANSSQQEESKNPGESRDER